VRIEYLDCVPLIVPGIRSLKYKRRNIATTEEIRALFTSSPNLRTKALIACAYGCGLRRAELVRLNQSDINFTSQVLLVRIAKGEKSREVPISDEMYNRTWRSSHSNSTKPTSSFLISDKGTRLSGVVMNQMLKSVIYRTNIDELKKKNLTLHCLRHSIATHLIDNGAGVEFVQQFLGHSDIDTTNLYAINRKRHSSILKKLFYHGN
jgi:site-specific recombinase XerD